MKFNKLFDEGFILEVSKDKEKLLEVVRKDYGFVFKQMERFNIKPEKEMVINIINEYPCVAAIVYLFNNYKLSSKEKGSYSKYFKKSASMSESLSEATNVDAETIIDILQDTKKNCLDFDYLLTAEDFKRLNVDFTKFNIDYEKNQYIEKCLLNMDLSNVLEFPHDFIVKFPKLINENYESVLEVKSIRDKIVENLENNEAITLTVNATIKLLEKTLNPKVFWLASNPDISISNVSKLINASQKYLPDLPFSECYKNFRNYAKTVVLCDLADMVDTKQIEKKYLNDYSSLNDDLGYSFKMRKTMLPKINDLMLAQNIMQKERGVSQQDLSTIIDIMNKNKEINFSQFRSNYFIGNLERTLEKNDDEESTNVNREDVISFFKNWWNSAISNNVSYIDEIPNTVLKDVVDDIPNSYQKIFLLSRVSKEYYENNIDSLSKGLNPLLIKDLMCLITDKSIPVDSDLFKEETFFKLNKNGKFNMKTINFLPDEMVEELVSKDLINVKDGFWKENIQNIHSEYKLRGFEKSYILKNIDNQEMGDSFKKFIAKYKSEAVEARKLFPDSFKEDSLFDISKKLCEEISNFEINNKDAVQRAINKRNSYMDYDEEEEEEFEVIDTSVESKYLKMLKEKKNLSARFKEVKYSDALMMAKDLNPKTVKEIYFVATVFFSMVENFGKSARDYLNNQYKDNPEIIMNIMRDGNREEINYLIDYSDSVKIVPEDKKIEFSKLAIDNGMKSDVLSFLIEKETNLENFQKDLKELLLTEYPYLILKDNYALNKAIPDFDIDDYIKTLSSLQNQTGFYMVFETNSSLSSLLKTAIKNTDEEIFWSRVEEMKIENPAIYTLMLTPTALREIRLYQDDKKDFLVDRLALFEEDYFERFPERKFKNDYSGKPEKVTVEDERFIYDYIDVDVLANGLNDIRNSLLDKVIDDYKTEDYSQNFPNEDHLFPYFRSVSDIYRRSDAEQILMEDDKLKLFVDKLLELDLANLYFLNSSTRLIKNLNKDDLMSGIIRKFEDIQDIDKLLLGGTVFKENLSYYANYKDYYFTQDGKKVNNLMSNILDNLVSENIEVGVYLNFLCDLSITSQKHFSYSLKDKVPEIIGKVVGYSELGLYGIESCAKAYDIQLGLKKSKFDEIPMEIDTFEDSGNSFKL